MPPPAASGSSGLDLAPAHNYSEQKLVILLHVVGFWTPIPTVVTLVVGVGTAAFPMYYLSSSTLIGFSATFVPALGWYLTILGGVLFSVVGGLQLPSVIRRPTATASPRDSGSTARSMACTERIYPTETCYERSSESSSSLVVVYSRQQESDARWLPYRRALEWFRCIWSYTRS